MCCKNAFAFASAASAAVAVATGVCCTICAKCIAYLCSLSLFVLTFLAHGELPSTFVRHFRRMTHGVRWAEFVVDSDIKKDCGKDHRGEFNLINCRLCVAEDIKLLASKSFPFHPAFLIFANVFQSISKCFQYFAKLLTMFK